MSTFFILKIRIRRTRDGKWFEEVTAEDVASDVKGLKFFGKEDNEKIE